MFNFRLTKSSQQRKTARHCKTPLKSNIVSIESYAWLFLPDFAQREIACWTSILVVHLFKHLPCPGWVWGATKRQTFATGIFKTEFSLCHFWIRTRNECSAISDLAIHKLLDFCTRYLCIPNIDNHQVQTPTLFSSSYVVLYQSTNDWSV